MVRCQGRGTQSLLVLLIQGGLPVYTCEEAVGQGFINLDSLLQCGVRAIHISGGLALSPIPALDMLAVPNPACS